MTETTRNDPVALIVLHTAGFEPDYSLPDASTERLADQLMTSASCENSWHATVDADSVHHGLPSDLVASHVRGWNTRTVAIGMVTRHDLWNRMPADHGHRIVENAARVAAWFCKVHDVPPELVVTFDEARAGKRGLIARSTLEPGSHEDPGVDFPWGDFVDRVRTLTEAENMVGPGDRGTQVSAAQCRLTDLGYGDLVGSVDGRAGSRFDLAVRAYERDRGLGSTGLWLSPVDVDCGARTQPSAGRRSPIELLAAVGPTAENRPDDRRAVIDRLDALGFMRPGCGLDHCLRLFQVAVSGADSLNLVDGRVDPTSATLAWLNAVNAPRWIRLPEGSPTDGFQLQRQHRRADDRSWATNWLADVLLSAGTLFRDEYLDRTVEATPFRVLGAATTVGGGELGAVGQNGLGLQCSVASTMASARGVTVDSTEYDRAATRAAVRAFQRTGAVDAVYLNDPVLVTEGLCQRGAPTDDRFLVTIRPQERRDN